MSPKKCWILGIAVIALSILGTFGWCEWRQAQETQKQIQFFQEWNKLDFSTPAIPLENPNE